MRYRVEIAQRAEADLEDLYRWVTAHTPAQGARWFNGLERAVLSLEVQPRRCPVAAESFDTEQPIRVLLYGRKPHSYRIFFIILEQKRLVQVLHVRHGARRRPSARELELAGIPID